MKKIILSAVAILAFGFANAQDKPAGGGAGLASGDVYLTGTFNYSSQKQADQKNDGLTIAPGIGYMITDNIALEGSLNFGSATTNDGNVGSDDVKSSSFGLSAGAAYFFTPADAFSVSLGGRLSYDMETEKDAIVTANGVEDVKTNTIGLNVPVGLHYFVSDHFAITTSWGGLRYTSAKADTDGAEASNTISLGLNLSTITWGLIYKL